MLLPAVEEGTVTLIGATTENPYFSLNTPLLSRCLLLRLEPLSAEDVGALVLHRALARRRPRAGRARPVESTMTPSTHLVEIGRRRRADGADRPGGGRPRRRTRTASRRDHARAEPPTRSSSKAIVYDRQGDAHYDVISAFIKSIRGSDPDAALFWLARMLEAGEDPRFIARRLIVHASEDIGLADPLALLVATAAAHAVEHVGLPGGPAEPGAGHDLSRPGAQVQQRRTRRSARAAGGRAGEPSRCRRTSATPATAARGPLGHGKGYVYPHDYPGHWVEQEYRPDGSEDHRYYEPSDMGEDVVRLDPRSRSRAG